MINLTPQVQSKVRKTKAEVRSDLQSVIDKAHADCQERISAMREQASNPQVAMMIEKNKGYLAALEDVTELLYNRNIF